MTNSWDPHPSARLARSHGGDDRLAGDTASVLETIPKASARLGRRIQSGPGRGQVPPMQITRRASSIAARIERPRPSLQRAFHLHAVAVAALIVFSAQSVPARILSNGDRASIAQMKPRYAEVLSEVARTAERSDLPAADGECVRETLRALPQISD